MVTVTVAGHRLVYTAVGDPHAPPAILVHGWFSHRGVWQQTMEALADDYYCIAPDLPGFGDSEKPPEADYSIQAQGQRILHLADQLGLEHLTLIGHSMGGQIVLYIAAQEAPQRVTTLVSVSGVVTGRLSPLVEWTTYPFVALNIHLPGLHTLCRRLSRYRWFAHLIFRPWFYRMEALSFADWEIDRRMALQPGLQIPAYKAGQAIRNLDLTPSLPQITARTLAIFGQQDGTVPLSDGYLVEQHVPDSRLALIDQCGHFPMYEQPQRYLTALTDFLPKN